MAIALVTGAAGFIGAHLAARLLAAGHQVRGLDNFDPYYDRAQKERNLRPLLAAPRFEWHEADLGTVALAPLLAGVETVYHLAARPGVRRSWGASFADYVRINVLATQRLLEALRATPRTRLVYASSSSVYGEQGDAETPETAPCLPISPYGVTKLATESLARAYHASYGVAGIGLRYFTVYGPSQRPDMAFHRFLRAAHEEREIVLYGDGSQTRDFTYIDDAVAATLSAGEAGRPGAVYNVGGGSPADLRTVLRIVAQLTGRPPRVRHEAPQPGDPQATRADTSSARADLGFRPAVSLEEGLRRMHAWMAAWLVESATAAGPAGGSTGGDHAAD
jgi:UDP-glucose 4-epimerase